jgi:hypothetical protein
MSRAIAILILSVLVASAAQAVSDLEGRVEIENGAYIPAGTNARAVLTLINNGPDAIISDFAAMGTFYVPNVGFRTIELIPSVETSPCTVHYMDFTVPPPQLSLISVVVLANRPVPPGTSVSCVVNLSVYPEAPSSFVQRFSFTWLDDDPNPANNVVDVLIRTRLPQSVSLPTHSRLGMFLLLTAAVALAASRLRKSF